MSNIVLSDLKKLDFSTTMTDVEVVESTKNLSGANTSVSELSEVDLKEARTSSATVYVPATVVSDQDLNKSKVYFDLENYPFYQAAKEIVSKDVKPKGVFRFRRTVNQNKDNTIFATDLVVLTDLLGEPVDINIKQTNQSLVPSHTIVMVNFGGGTMAHIEYTVSDHERIELEWSGDKNIIEFDSNEMRGIKPGNMTRLPLMYSVDTILETAHEVDEELLTSLNRFKDLLNGGANK